MSRITGKSEVLHLSHVIVRTHTLGFFFRIDLILRQEQQSVFSQFHKADLPMSLTQDFCIIKHFAICAENAGYIAQVKAYGNPLRRHLAVRELSRFRAYAECLQGSERNFPSIRDQFNIW